MGTEGSSGTFATASAGATAVPASAAFPLDGPLLLLAGRLAGNGEVAAAAAATTAE